MDGITKIEVLGWVKALEPRKETRPDNVGVSVYEEIPGPVRS
jgi:hypothetical protein